MPKLTTNEDFFADFSRFYILTLLYEQPQHGYGIMSAFKERTGKEISPSIVYPFLRQLEKKGLVNHSLKPVGAKKKKVFGLTMQGLELCRHLFRRFSSLLSVAIEPSLTICANCGCKIFEGAYKEVIDDEEMAFCCNHCARFYKKEQIRTRRARKPQEPILNQGR